LIKNQAINSKGARRVADFVERGSTGAGAGAASVESRASWGMALLSLGILSVSYGSPLLAIVGLKPITEDLHTSRQVVALAGGLYWLGTGAGGIVMGWVAERLGIRATVAFGGVMIAAGLAVSAIGNAWTMLAAHLVLIGFFGNGAVFPPLIVHVSHWFDRRRGTAMALVWSGQYLAGIVWPTVFERSIEAHGWRTTMLGFAALLILVVPAAAMFFRRPPQFHGAAVLDDGLRPARRSGVLGLRPNLVLALIAAAGFCCCVPMALPQNHLVAFCSDLGIPAAQGAAMLSVMTGSALVARVFWGWLTDRIGGLRTVLAGSACQAVAIAAFLTTQDEAGLFAISAAYGLGFSGLIPAYVVAIRELFPPSEASWRVPSVLFVSMSGMAFGGWFAGALYDHFGFYAPAFGVGIVFNIANLALVGYLVARERAGIVLRPAAA
jgi:MFS family permease